jgi:hypothetical protein
MANVLRLEKVVLFLLLAGLLVVLLTSERSPAATPASGTINAGSTVSWDFGPVGGGTVTNVGVQDICPPAMCDNFDMTVVLPAPATLFYQTNTAKLTIKYTWTSTVPTDLDIFAISPAAADFGPGSPDDTSTGPGEEVLTLTDPAAGLWHVRSVASLAPIPTAAHAVATLTVSPRPTVPPPPPPPPGAPTFVNYAAPDNLPCTPLLPGTTCSNGAHSAGEPSIGADWATGAVLFQSYVHTLKVTFDDSKTPATASWVDKRALTSRTSLDPILFTDSRTNRTFTSHLDLACSLTSFTDDDGDHWTPSQGCGTPAGIDHQTIGGGPYAFPPPPLRTYPDAFYYCSQDIATAFCARSDDGGLTFGVGVPIYTLISAAGVGQCGGLHGHIRVSPDGTAYVPNNSCLDTVSNSRKQGFAASADNGLSWVIKTVPDSKASRVGGDPSLAAGSKNTVYFGYANADGHPKIAVSHDRGDHWSKSKDVGTPFGIQNTQFSEVIAGDDDRAAFAFLGTTTGGDSQASTFAGVWHLYVAVTYDGGRTWITTDATPADPVQRGCIWNGGGSNPCRNLLDFNDITVDKFGRVLVGYADGCTGTCVHDPSQNASTGPASAQDQLATIARQVAGRGLFAAFDGTGFGTGTNGGGKQCSGDPAKGVSGDPDCNDHDDDD